MVFYETNGKKENKWEFSSDIGKYDNMYKLTFKVYNAEGSSTGEMIFYSEIKLKISEKKFEKCVSTFMDVTGQVLFRDLENFFMECHDSVVSKKSK